MSSFTAAPSSLHSAHAHRVPVPGGRACGPSSLLPPPCAGGSLGSPSSPLPAPAGTLLGLWRSMARSCLTPLPQLSAGLSLCPCPCVPPTLRTPAIGVGAHPNPYDLTCTIHIMPLSGVSETSLWDGGRGHCSTRRLSTVTFYYTVNGHICAHFLGGRCRQQYTQLGPPALRTTRGRKP